MANRLNAFNSTRLIASGRLLLAEFLFFCAATDPGNAGFRPQWDDFTALAYLGLSLAVMAVVWRSWWADFIVFPAVFAIDILVFLVLPWSLNPQWASFSVAAVAIAAFILLCSSVRWNWRTTVIFAVGLNLAALGLSFMREGALGLVAAPAVDLSIEEDMRRLLLLALVSLFIVWAGLRLNDPRFGTFDPKRSTSGQAYLGELLRAALEAGSASSGALVWAGKEAPRARLARIGSKGTLTTGEIDHVPPAPDSLEAMPALFDLERRRAIVVAPDDEFAAHRNADIDQGLLRQLNFASGISVPLNGATGRGRLVLTGFPLMGWDHLRLAQALGAEVVHALDREAFEIAERDAALTRLRQAVARDLHDSVAQSLAGARFWLRALKTRAGADQTLVDEIGQVETAFEAENMHIRYLIGQLRRKAYSSAERSLAGDLEDLLETLALHWRIETAMSGADALVRVPYQFSFEVQQIVREAVANAVRHGQASKVDLAIKGNGKNVHLFVSDNGGGFDAAQGEPRPISISERVEALGGTLSIQTEPGKTCLDIAIPAGAVA